MQMQADSSSPQSRLTLRIATLVGIGIEILIVGPIPMVIYTNLYRNYYHINTFVVALWEWEVILALCVIVPVI